MSKTILNIKAFVKNESVVFTVIIVCVISSAFIINFSYGLYYNFVTQKNERFSTTIIDNIAIGRPGATENEIHKAAQTAQAEDFILQQPDGYDTAVAEGGMSLSGGQRQRISIARALLKNAEILIFDDSTSALDLKTEAALYQALKKNYPGMTKIVIAQRIATARKADRIAVVDNGHIDAVGTHAELLEKSAVYRDICDSQERKGGAA